MPPSALKVIFFALYFCVCGWVGVGVVFRNPWTSNFAGMARELSL